MLLNLHMYVYVCRFNLLPLLIPVALINVSQRGALDDAVNTHRVKQTTGCSPACSPTLDLYLLMLSVSMAIACIDRSQMPE